MPRLEAAGHDVISSDRDLDVTDAQIVADRVARIEPDAVVHLAAMSNPSDSWKAPEQTYRVNFLGARSILEAIRRSAPAARVLLVGSAVQYGFAQPGSPPFTEAAPLRPTSPYARSKTAADLLGVVYGEFGVDVVRVRAFNHSGPGQTEQYALSRFARQAAEIAIGRREAVIRVGNSVRDFLDVEDVVDAYVRLLDRGVATGAYNVARGEGFTLRELLSQLIEIAGIDPSVEIDPDRIRPTDFSVRDSARLRNATGWKPRIPISQTLARLLGSWRERLSAS